MSLPTYFEYENLMTLSLKKPRRAHCQSMLSEMITFVLTKAIREAQWEDT
jgi:hypothetical protein